MDGLSRPRRVWANAVIRRFRGGASLESKYVSFMARSGDVAVRELSTGNSHRLSNQGHSQRAACPFFSPDSKQVDYNCISEETIVELRAIGIDSTPPRVVYARRVHRRPTTSTPPSSSKQEANETFCLDLFGLSSNSPFTKTRGIAKILNDN